MPSDVQPPVITLAGPLLVGLQKGEPYVEAGASAYDNVNGSIEVLRSGTVNTNIPGLYVLTYTATDQAGNSASRTRTVTVSNLEEDALLPVLACSVDAGVPVTGCGSDIWGCPDPQATNYNFRATRDDGSCEYLQTPSFGPNTGVPNFQYYSCDLVTISFTNYGGPIASAKLLNSLPSGLVFSPRELKIEGEECLVGEYPNALTITNSSGSATLNFNIVILNKCLRPGALGCRDRSATNFSETAVCDNGSCTYEGCTLTEALNYDSRATIKRVCIFVATPSGGAPAGLPLTPYEGGIIVRGCKDPSAINYCAVATEDDGSCRYCIPPEIKITQVPALIDWSQPLTLGGSTSLANGQTVTLTIQGGNSKTALVTQKEWSVSYSSAELGLLSPGPVAVVVTAGKVCEGGVSVVSSEDSVFLEKPSAEALGCMLPEAYNYDPEATTPGLCIFYAGSGPGGSGCPGPFLPYAGGIIVRGCGDPLASNYCSTVTEDDGSCEYCFPPEIKINQVPEPIDWKAALTVSGSATRANGQTVKVTIQGRYEQVVAVSNGEWSATFSSGQLKSLEEGSASLEAVAETSCPNTEDAVASVALIKPSSRYSLPVYVGVTASTGSCRSIHNITSFRVNGTPAGINPEFTSSQVVALGQGSWRLNPMEYDTGGGIWAYYPLDSKDFSASIDYNIIEPQDGGGRADGIALIFSKSPFLAGLGGGLGYQGGDPNSVAIEIDTYENHHDPDNHHIAVLQGGSVGTHLALVSRPNILSGSLEAEYAGGILKVKHNGSEIISLEIDIPGIIGTGTMTS